MRNWNYRQKKKMPGAQNVYRVPMRNWNDFFEEINITKMRLFIACLWGIETRVYLDIPFPGLNCLSRAYEELKHRSLKKFLKAFTCLSRAYEELKLHILISRLRLRLRFIACLWGIETHIDKKEDKAMLYRLSRAYEELKLPSYRPLIFTFICLSRAYEELKLCPDYYLIFNV